MIQRRIVALFLTLFLAIPVAAATAQTPTSSDPFPPSFDELAGLQSVVMRDYLSLESCNADEDDCMASGGFSVLTEEDILEGRYSLFSISVMEFDVADNAAAAFEPYSAGLERSLAARGQGEFTTEEPNGIGNQAGLDQGVFTSEGAVTNERTEQYLTFQQDEHLIVIFGMMGRGPSEEPLPELTDRSGPITALATEIAANGEPSPDEPVYAEDGASAGGLWGYMPAADNPLLMGLVPKFDQVLFPPSERQPPPSNERVLSELMPLATYPELEVAVQRMYMLDDALSHVASPVASGEISTLQPGMISVSIYEFGSLEAAEFMYSVLSEEAIQTMLYEANTSELTIHEELALGDQARLTGLDVASDHGLQSIRNVSVQRDTFVIVVEFTSGELQSSVDVSAGDSAASNAAVALATHIVDDGQPSTDEPTFAEDGTSTGGLWSFMPAADDPLLMGLIPFGDFVIYPEPEQ